MKKKLKICFIILFGLFLLVFSAHLLRNKNHEKTQNFSEEEKIFFKTKWISFYGARIGQPWFSHNDVDIVAQKILKLEYSQGKIKGSKEVFPFKILFISADGQKKIVWLNTRTFSFDRKKSFPHNIGDEIEVFYQDMGKYYVKNPENQNLNVLNE